MFYYCISGLGPLINFEDGIFSGGYVDHTELHKHHVDHIFLLTYEIHTCSHEFFVDLRGCDLLRITAEALLYRAKLVFENTSLADYGAEDI